MSTQVGVMARLHRCFAGVIELQRRFDDNLWTDDASTMKKEKAAHGRLGSSGSNASGREALSVFAECANDDSVPISKLSVSAAMMASSEETAVTRTHDIYDMPFSFTANGILKGNRKKQAYVLVDTVQVEIPQVSSSDAPIAARALKTSNGEVVVEHRAWKGRPVATMKGNGGDGSIVDPAEMLSRLGRLRTGSVDWQNYPVFLPHDWRGAVEILPHLAEEHEFKTVESSTRDAKMAEALDVLGGCVFVDGVLHAPAQELRWAAQPGKETSKIYLSTDTKGFENFRADRLEDARRFLSIYKSERRVRVHDLEDHGLIRWRFDDVLSSMQSCARKLLNLLESGTGPALIRMPPDLLALVPAIVDCSRSMPDPLEFLSLIEGVKNSLSSPNGTLEAAMRAAVLAPSARYRRIDGIGAASEDDLDALAGLELSAAPAPS